MRPTQATVDLFARQLGLALPPNAQTVMERWSYVSGYCVGLTDGDDGWTCQTVEQSHFWERGFNDARAHRRGLK